ncbi:blastoderm-specific protein 25D [Phthorimaea operculella]|nr:blastoderm-specific protein 25D [Phthorimaea operculella]
MDSTSLNHYEERLYSVFKTFDVDNSEALSEAAVLALCDALQLEARGAALVDTLFERRDQRVTFAQFRSGLLAVLADPAPPSSAPPPAPAPAEPPPAPAKPASDDDSSGREVAPKFVFGSKKYGRRSRPSRGRPSSSSPPSAPPQPPADPAAELELDHSSRVDAERALQLCRRLHMDGIDRRLVERVFETVPAGETTVGEFFDRLNALLSSSVDGAGAVAEAGALPGGERDQDEDDSLPTELVAEAWEAAGVQRARRLLAELGFSGAALHAAALERALDEECGALHEPAGHSARALLLLAALALARLRRDRTARRAADVAAERDRLRADVDEANRRARILAQEVDENHARLEADLMASLRRAETKHAEALRAVELERAAERERAAGERARFEEELARRVEAEQKLRAEAEAQRARAERLEARVAESEERVLAGERERARLAEELAAAAARAGGEAGEARRAADELAACADELRAENARLRDRCDELCAQLEARPRAPAEPAPPHTWHEEASAAVPLVTVPVKILEGESPPVSLEPSAAEAAEGTDAETEVAILRADLARAEEFHAEERLRFEELVKELETSLEAMREEYDRCEEYWSNKLQQERADSDARLRELQGRLQDLQRQYELSSSARLPAVPEQPSLEQQAQELDAAAADLARRDAALDARDAELARRDADLARRDAELSAKRKELARRERDLARLAHGLDALRRAAVSYTLFSVSAALPQDMTPYYIYLVLILE